jgi:hypothetical protein
MRKRKAGGWRTESKRACCLLMDISITALQEALASHIRMVPSSDPESMKISLPGWHHASLHTVLSCPLDSQMSEWAPALPRVTFHSTICPLLAEHAITSFLMGCHLTSWMLDVLPPLLMWCTSPKDPLLGVISWMLTMLSILPPPVHRNCASGLWLTAARPLPISPRSSTAFSQSPKEAPLIPKEDSASSCWLLRSATLVFLFAPPRDPGPPLMVDIVPFRTTGPAPSMVVMAAATIASASASASANPPACYPSGFPSSNHNDGRLLLIRCRISKQDSFPSLLYEILPGVRGASVPLVRNSTSRTRE